MRKIMTGALALAGVLALTAGASAASRAYATTNVNLRAGPSTAYPAVDVIGAGDNVRVFGCLSTRSWCDVGYSGIRGWMSSNYLAEDYRVRRYTGPRIVDEIDAPIITFSVGSYWDDHYRGRGFYRERARYARPDFRPGPDPRDFDRRDFRDDRRDFRDDRRDARREFREERRDRRDAFRDERRDDRGPGRGPGRDFGPDGGPNGGPGGPGPGPGPGPDRLDGPPVPLYRVN